MAASKTVNLLLQLLIKYGGVPAKEAVILIDDLDEIREDVITITNSEIKDLVANQKELVAAPGAGKIVVLHDLTLKLNYGGSNVTKRVKKAHDALDAKGNTFTLDVNID